MDRSSAVWLLALIAIATIADASPTPPFDQERTGRRHQMARNKEMEGHFEGDMKLNPDQKSAVESLIMKTKYEGTSHARTPRDAEDPQGKATTNLSTRWPGGVVPFLVHDSLDHARDILQLSMRHWEMRTCIRFVPWTPEVSEELGHPNYLDFVGNEAGCWSYVGMYRPAQPVSVGRGCEWLEVIAHEIGHAIGFWHEQSRPDRDNYVIIHRNNINEDNFHNFEKYNWQQVTTHEVPYDIASIMHYSPYAFSINGQPTITARSNVSNPDRLGTAEGLSCADIKLANLMYQCEGDDWEDCNDDDEGSEYELPDMHEAVLYVVNTESGEGFWGGDDTPCVIQPGQVYEAFCWSSLRVLEEDFDDVGLQFVTGHDTPDGYNETVVTDDVQRHIDERVFSYDESSQYGGRPFIYIGDNIGSGDWNNVRLSCRVESISGDHEVQDEEKSLIFKARCDNQLHVPCGEECVDDMSILCNGEEECPGDSDERDCEESCNAILTEEGEISSPGFPDNYPDNAQCVQLLVAPDGEVVVLRFEHFSVEPETNCFWDAVEVYDGDSPDAERIGAFCGDRTPSEIVSSGKMLLVIFRSDDSVNFPGYLASFHFAGGSGGGGDETVTEQEFYGGFTGHIDLQVPEDAENWRIQVEFPIKLKSLKLTNCEAEVVGVQRKTRFIIQNKRGRGGVEEGDRLRIGFSAITSRKKKGAVGRVDFMSLD